MPRARKKGDRYPSGKLKPGHRRLDAKPQTDRYSPCEVKRLVDLAVAGVRDAVYGTVLGRAYLEGKIDSRQLATGKRWADLASEYQSHFGLPNPSPKPASLDGRAGGQEPDPDSDLGRARAKKAEKVRKAFDLAHRALLSEGQLAYTGVRCLCEGTGTIVDWQMFIAAKRGLDALGRHWE